MRNVMLILCITILLPALAQAQTTGRISGTVSDAVTKLILEGATISVLNDASGIYLNHGVSNKKGEFQVGGLPVDQPLQVIISFTGYKDTSAVFSLSAKSRILPTGTWSLHISSDDMDSVTVSFRRPPFIVKKDTLEFDGAAFKSLPSDMVQDLLRKIPGMTVDEQGRVTVNGKKVSRIKVDGREFFSNNVKTAMENLPGTAIDKVQVTDTRERGTEHNSIIKPIAQEVTLNLTLKKQYKKGAFGHASAGAGTLDRYRAGGFLNFIKGQQRYAVYAGAGNLAGGAQSHLPVEVFAGGPGIPGANSSAGFSANVAMGKKSTLDLSYALDNNRSSVSTTTQQTNILPDSTFLYDNISSTSTINKTHRLATQYVNTIDTLQQFTMAPSVDFSDNTTHSTSDARSSTTTGDAINTQRNTNVNRDKNLSVANRATYSRASHDRKTNLNINWDFRLRNNNGTLDNRSENKFYHSAAIPSDTLNQQSAIKSNGLSNNVSVNLSRELGKHFAAIFNYTFAQTTDDYDKDTYDYNAVTGVHDSLDSLYSVHSHNTNVTHLPSASIGFHAGKLTLELGAGMRFIQQANKNIWKDSSIRIAQRNFSPRITTAYQFARYMQWNTNYTVGAEAPTPDQLAPVQDNTNPLYIRTGNPYLRSAITHNISTEMRTWSSDYRWHGGVRGTALISGNQIVDDTYYDTLGRQISTYQNTNGNYQVSGGVDAGARIKLNQWVLNADVASEVGRSQNNGFINQQQNKTVTTTIGPMLNLGIQYKQLLTIQAIGQVNYNSTHYSLEGINDVQYNTKRLFFLGKLSL